MKKFTSIIVFAALFISNAFSQEFNLTVKLNVVNNVMVDRTLYAELERGIEEFYNNTKWTEDEYEAHERISGAINITVSNETGPNTFTVDLTVQTSRPVYNASYQTTLLNYVDKGIDITYNPGQPIQKSDVSYFDHLSSILTYYAYIMLGYDYDSFAPLGGDPYFTKARDIITTLPPSIASSPGWDSRGGIVGRNRFWLQENLLNNKLKPFRQFLYEYHRLGLDELYKDADRQRAVLASAINGLQPVLDSYPNAMPLQLFSDAKRDEIVEIFKVADRGQKAKVYSIMTQCDPARAEVYSPLSR